MMPSLSERIARLNTALLDTSSATLAMETWCENQGLAKAPVRLTVRLDHPPPPPIPAVASSIFPSDEPLQHRQVVLCCGTLEVARADNWYAPSRLTTEMNHRLETSSIPFGRVVADLNIDRDTLDSTLLWQEGQTLTSTTAIIRHVATVFRADRLPLSVVQETFTAALLGF
ncbi:hypothetical protein [Acetobacter conturbans]|uniref:Chorismate lyase n=1 Tax=Acetobacter conturbans TaxID=1737472 RepID=A0ABX0K089_9PROT|nr:hypothetical protein [Acetobacter conturbans]NHN87159.1 hypothetical protein [Acetobacter conturbans]